jgi:aryl-alcohol dehydrogenase-like predicted oxidoreductase
VPALRHYGIGLLPYFPLANGLLTGKYRRGEPAPPGTRIAESGRDALLTDRVFDVVEALTAFAQSRSISLLDVAIGGLAAQPAVGSVIAGATSREQVQGNVAAGDWEPTPDDLAELDELTRPQP